MSRLRLTPLLSRPLTFPGAKVGCFEKASSDCFRQLPTVSLAAHQHPDKRYENCQERGFLTAKSAACRAANLSLPQVSNLRLDKP